MVLGYVGAKLAIKFKKGYKILTKIEFDGNKNTNCSSLPPLNHALNALLIIDEAVFPTVKTSCLC